MVRRKRAGRVVTGLLHIRGFCWKFHFHESFSINKRDTSKILIRKHTLPYPHCHTYHWYAFSTLGDRCVYMHRVMLLVRSDSAVVFLATPQFASSIFCHQWLVESHGTVLLFTKGVTQLIRHSFQKMKKKKKKKKMS